MFVPKNETLVKLLLNAELVLGVNINCKREIANFIGDQLYVFEEVRAKREKLLAELDQLQNNCPHLEIDPHQDSTSKTVICRGCHSVLIQ